MSDIKSFEAALEAKLAEQKAEVAAATEKAAKAFESKVEAVNEEIAKNNKTLLEARQEILDAKAAFGKLSAAKEEKVEPWELATFGEWASLPHGVATRLLSNGT